MSEATRNFTTPVGRLVGGDVFKPRTKDFDGRPLMTKNNEPRKEYVVQVAFDKNDQATQEMWAQVYAVAQESFPSLFSNGAPPGFSFKVQDGDDRTPNMRGNIPAEKDGFPGCLVFTFKTSFAPTVVDQHKNPITDPNMIKRGYYIRLSVSCKGNGSQSKPGVYLNQSLVQLCGYGEEIASGPDPDQAFAEPAHLPAGASTTPVAPAGGVPGAPPAAGTPPAPGAAPAAPPAPGGAPAAPPAPGAAPAAPAAPPAPGGAPAPVPGFGMQPGAQPPAAPPAAAPPAQPAPPPAQPAAAQYKTKPGSPTYESMIGAGWTHEQIQNAGYLA